MSETKYLRSFVIAVLLMVTALPLGAVPRAGASVTGYWSGGYNICRGQRYQLRNFNLMFQNEPYELTLKIYYGDTEKITRTRSYDDAGPHSVSYYESTDYYLPSYGEHTAVVYQGQEKVFERAFNVLHPYIRVNKNEAMPGETIEIDGFNFCHCHYGTVSISIGGQVVATGLSYYFHDEPVVVPDLPPGMYTITASDYHTTTEAPLLVDYFVWDNIVDQHQQPGTFGYLVNDIKTMIGGLGSGGGLEDLQADLTAHRTQVEDIISTIDWTDIAALNLILGDETQFTSNAELLALKEQLEAQLTTINTDLLDDISDLYTALMSHDVYAREVLDTIDWNDVDYIKGILDDDTRFTSDAELTALRDELAAQLTAMKEGLSSEISDLLIAL